MIKSRNFSAKLLLLADGSSIFGGWIDFVVILTAATYAYDISSWQMALLGAGSLLPSIILSSQIARWADSSKCLLMLRVSILIRSLLTLSLIFSPNFSAFFILVVLRATANSFAIPAIMTITARNIDSDDRTRYYSLLKVVNSISKISAPAMGGAIASFYGSDVAFYISSALCFTSFIAFTFLRESAEFNPRNAQDQNGVPHKGPKSQRPVGNNQSTWYIYAGIMLVFCLASIPMNNQLPVLLKGGLLGVNALGYLITSSGSGSLIYALYKAWYSKSSSDLPPVGTMIIPGCIGMLMFIIMGLCIWIFDNPLIYLCVTFFISGIFTSRFLIATNIFMAAHMCDYLGYATSKIQAIQNITLLIAPFYGAWMMDVWSVPVVFVALGVFGGFGMIAIGMGVIRLPHLQHKL